METIFLILAMLFVKHWYIDFVNQSNEEITHKGDYLNWTGMNHSIKHGYGTFFVFFWFTNVYAAFTLALADFLIHYHIDYLKMKYGEVRMTRKAFWTHLGADQLAHHLTYLILVWSIVWNQ